jgi:hypothetical protein
MVVSLGKAHCGCVSGLGVTSRRRFEAGAGLDVGVDVEAENRIRLDSDSLGFGLAWTAWTRLLTPGIRLDDEPQAELLNMLLRVSRRPTHHRTAQHSTLHHVTSHHSMAHHNTAQHSTAQHSTAHCCYILSASPPINDQTH